VVALPTGALSCDKPVTPPDMPDYLEAQMPLVAQLQLDLLALAFACDLTRVGTIMFSDAQDHIAMPFDPVNIPGDVHNVSHDSEPGRAALGNRDAWVAQQLAYFMGRLHEVKVGDGTLLDSTCIFWGSEVSIGNIHSHDNMPFVLAGHGAGFRMGRALKFGGDPHNGLLTSILNGLGGTYTGFGDANIVSAPLSGLT
jgi:hypothetical protein